MLGLNGDVRMIYMMLDLYVFMLNYCIYRMLQCQGVDWKSFNGIVNYSKFLLGLKKKTWK